MKRKLRNVRLAIGHMDHRQVQLGLVVVTLVLLVIGASAPSVGGGH